MNPEELHNSLVLVYATLLLIAFIGQKSFIVSLGCVMTAFFVVIVQLVCSVMLGKILNIVCLSLTLLILFRLCVILIIKHNNGKF